MQGDVVAIYNESGAKVVSYVYNAWGSFTATYHNGGDDILAVYENPLRYRGYYYDRDLGMYYLGSRYYDYKVGRFISPDTPDVLTVTPMSLTDKNLYAYCDNNPVMRIDEYGEFWESIWDVLSFGASVVEVAVNPTDIWAWAGLFGDTIDVLVPFAGGLGESTRAIKTIVNSVDSSADILSTAKVMYKNADATSDIRKATGSYEIIYRNGKNYIGKGGFNRAINSAVEHSNGLDDILSIRWKSAPTARDAFIDEYFMQKRFGGVLSDNHYLLTYNKIWSPGRRYWGD